MTKTEAIAFIASEFEMNPELSADLLEGFDVERAWDATRSQLVAEVWDKKTPINGVSASRVLAKRTDIPEGGAIVLVRDAVDGRVVLFQPFQPGESGFMPIEPSEAIAVASRLAFAEASDRFRLALRSMVQDKINLAAESTVRIKS